MNQNISGVQSNEGRVASLTELLAAAIGTDSTLRLYQASFNPIPSNVRADFLAAQCDFSGYAGVALTFGTPGMDADGNAVAFADEATFAVADPATVGNDVGGAWIDTEVSTGPSVLKAVTYFQFPTPIPMSVALRTLSAVVAMKAPNVGGSISITY